MSWQATSWVIEHSKHKGSTLLTLLCIANCADQDGLNAFPSISRLAKDTRMCERQVRRIIRTLEKSGELRTRIKSAGRVNFYDLPLVRTPDKMSAPTPDTAMTPPPDIAVPADPKDSKNLNPPSVSPSRSYQPKSAQPKPPPEPKILCPENILDLASELRETYTAEGRDLDAIAKKWFHYFSGQTRSKLRTLEEWGHCFHYWMQDEKNSGNGKPRHESASERNVRYIRESLAEFELPALAENGHHQSEALLLAAGAKPGRVKTGGNGVV